MTRKYEGDLVARPGVVYDYTEITGWLYAFGADTRTAFPALTAVGGWLDARGADTRTAFPALTAVGGSLDASGADTRTEFPALTAVGGSLNVSGADTRTAFPALTAVGGSLYVSGADTRTAFPALDQSTVGHKEKLDSVLRRLSFVFQDGILSRIVSHRRGVYRVMIVGQTKTSYVIERDGQTAHGETLRLARSDLLYKLGKRDLSQYKKWTPKTTKPIEEMIAAYRAITGACGQGIALFVRGRKYPARLSVARAIKESRGQYGGDMFKRFFTKEGKA